MLWKFFGIILSTILLCEAVFATTVCGKIVKYEVESNTITLESGVSYKINSPKELASPIISSALAANLNVCVGDNTFDHTWTLDSISR